VKIEPVRGNVYTQSRASLGSHPWPPGRRHSSPSAFARSLHRGLLCAASTPPRPLLTSMPTVDIGTATRQCPERYVVAPRVEHRCTARRARACGAPRARDPQRRTRRQGAPRAAEGPTEASAELLRAPDAACTATASRGLEAEAGCKPKRLACPGSPQMLPQRHHSGHGRSFRGSSAACTSGTLTRTAATRSS